MKRAIHFANRLAQEYAHVTAKGNPRILCRIPEEKRKESFSVHYAGGEICIEAESPQSAIYGLRIMAAGVSSGHYAEFLGEWQPRFPLRPLWLGSELDVTLGSHVGITIPAWLRQEKDGSSTQFENFCHRVLDYGYNSVLLGNLDNFFVVSPVDSSFNFEAICDAFHEFGLKVILKPNFFLGNLKSRCPFNISYTAVLQEGIQELFEKVPNLDYLFYESTFQHPESMQDPLAFEATQLDLAKSELHLIEKALPERKQLIFFIPAQDEETANHHAAWLSALSDLAGNRTSLAFSAVAGYPWEDHCRPHPFWNAMRKSPDVSNTPLMPIVNIGTVRQGEGLWPTLSLDLIEHYFGRCDRHPIAGVICLVGQLPFLGAILDCNLWVSSQMMWRPRSVDLYAQTWFQAYRPDLNYPLFFQKLKEIRQISLDLSYLRTLHTEKHRDLMSSEEFRHFAGSLLARIKHLKIQFEKEDKRRIRQAERPTLYEYFSFFERDAKRIVLNFLQRFNVPLLHYREEEDHQEGFWTSAQGPTGRFSSKSIFLDQPNKGQPGSRMNLIFKETRLF